MAYLKYFGVLLIMCLAGLILLGLSTRSFEYEYEVFIPTRSDTVWHKIIREDSLVHWFPGLKAVTIDSGISERAPLKMTWTIDLEGTVQKIPAELSFIDKPDTVEYVMYRPDAVKKVRWAIKPLVEKNTLITGFYTWTPKGFFRRIMYRFNSLSLGYQDQWAMEQLRDRCKAQKRPVTEK